MPGTSFPSLILAAALGAACAAADASAQAGPASPQGPSGTGGAAQAPGAEQISPDQIDAYLRVRREIAAKDPGLVQRLAEVADPSAERDRLAAVLAGSHMSAEEFIRVHRGVQRDPALRSRVEAELGGVATSGGAASEPTQADRGPARTDAGGAGATARTGTEESRRAAGEIPEETLERYLQSRQQVERSDPGLKTAMEGGTLSAERDRLQIALSGALMAPEEFLQVHREVLAHPDLRARVDAALRESAPTGASGSSGGDRRTPEPTGGAVPAPSPR